LATDLQVIVRGNVPGGIKKEVLHTLRDCYKQFKSRAPERVEVHLVDKLSTMLDFLKEEKFRLGVTATGNQHVLCCHDAWRGFPRIAVCTDEFAKADKLVKIGAIRREAAHSALHGSLEYYIFQISEESHRLARLHTIEYQTLEEAMFHVSEAVKDFEATRYLVENGYIKCQVAFLMEMLQPSEELKTAWKSVSRTKRQTRYLCDIAVLKPILFANPLLRITDPKKLPLQQQLELGKKIEAVIEFMDDMDKKKLLQAVNNIVDALGGDTNANVDIALTQSLSLI
jgi:hypothetical protein